MSSIVGDRGRDRTYWGLATASAPISLLVLTVGGLDAFHIAVTGGAVVAAACMAIGDKRTGLLRNAWTGPFAAAALMQVLIATLGLPRPSDAVATAGIALLINVGAYTTMGLVGWVGLGDVKFVAGLTLFATLLAGAASMLIPPIALLAAAVARAALPGRTHSSVQRPHGPALVVAFTLVLGAIWPHGFGV